MPTTLGVTFLHRSVVHHLNPLLFFEKLDTDLRQYRLSDLFAEGPEATHLIGEMKVRACIQIVRFNSDQGLHPYRMFNH